MNPGDPLFHVKMLLQNLRASCTAEEILAAWDTYIAGARKPTVEEVRAAMVVGVEQGEMRWADHAPNGQPRVALPSAQYIPYNAGWDEK